MKCMKCWGLEVTRTFILCIGAIGQKHIMVPRAQSWNGGNGCCLCWFVHRCICHRTNLPQNWVLTIPRANSFYVEVSSKAGIPSPSWNSWSWVFLSYHCFCCCCVLTRSTLSDQLRHLFHLLLHGEQVCMVNCSHYSGNWLPSAPARHTFQPYSSSDGKNVQTWDM